MNLKLYDNDDRFSFGVVVELKMRYIPIAQAELIARSFAAILLLLGCFE